ncbi:LOB domain-containing protein 7-like [Lotus japonicus]|uniref:LOB domain-containing protein 7-like n=1 Tax=Lotus japonicus TaxID=34305 RepID=UPI002584F17F|nr:LOB domain-containing protein 7-like [Lotus japonicus]
MENDNDNTSPSRTVSPAANNDNTATNIDNTATNSRIASTIANNDNTAATTSRTPSIAANNDNTATIIRTASGAYNKNACAACSYLRKKCTADCILAPYFPQSRRGQFANALRLFTVSKMISIIKNMDPRTRDDAMTAIRYQSDVRARDLVGGCYRYIQHLDSEIAQRQNELNEFRTLLEYYRRPFIQEMMPQPQQNHPGFQDEIPLMFQDDNKEQEGDENDDQKNVLELNKKMK